MIIRELKKRLRTMKVDGSSINTDKQYIQELISFFFQGEGGIRDISV